MCGAVCCVRAVVVVVVCGVVHLSGVVGLVGGVGCCVGYGVGLVLGVWWWMLFVVCDIAVVLCWYGCVNVFVWCIVLLFL